MRLLPSLKISPLAEWPNSDQSPINADKKKLLDENKFIFSPKKRLKLVTPNIVNLENCENF